MSKEPSAYEKERITHINYLMDTLHDSTSVIYEALIDRDFKELRSELTKTIDFLKEIQSSLEDDI